MIKVFDNLVRWRCKVKGTRTLEIVIAGVAAVFAAMIVVMIIGDAFLGAETLLFEGMKAIGIYILMGITAILAIVMGARCLAGR